MFHFSHSHLLFLALLIPPILYLWWRRKRGTIRHPSLDLLPTRRSLRVDFARWGGLILRGLALLGVVIALAGPRWPDRRTRIVTEGIAIGMVVDISASMGQQDFIWKDKPISRLQAVQRVFRLFVKGGADSRGLKGRPTDLIGLVVFATRPDVVCPLTLSHTALLRILDEQKPKTIPGQSETNISDALVLGLQRLQSAGERKKILILLSDGEHNVPNVASKWTPRQVADVAVSLKIPIYIIDAGGHLSGAEAGTEESEKIREAGRQILRDVAKTTRGQYFQANSTDDLLRVYRIIDQKERARIESFQYRRYHEGYHWFGLASLILLMIVGGLEMTLWRQVP